MKIMRRIGKSCAAWRKAWMVCLAVLLAPTFALAGADHGAGELEVITLKHRRAEQLLPQLILFVESGGEIAGTGNTLFLRASPKNRAEIHALVDTLDTPPRRLMISVRQEGDDSGEVDGVDVSGRVILGDGAPAVRGEARIDQRERRSQRTVSQRIQTLEGARAAIVSGQSLVLPMRQLTVTPTGVVIAQTIVQQYLGTGFATVPYLNGDRVTLEIMPFDDTAGRLPGSVNTQHLVTTVSGRLGEWIPLGGAEIDARDEQRALLGGDSRAASRHHRLLLKVDELP